MKMESFKACLFFPSLLILECLVLGNSTSGNNTITFDRLQLFAVWYHVRSYPISRKREINRLFTKYFVLLVPMLFQKAIQKQIYLVLWLFLKVSRFILCFLGLGSWWIWHVSCNIHLKQSDPSYKEIKIVVIFPALHVVNPVKT